jgi:hypothetical protein
MVFQISSNDPGTFFFVLLKEINTKGKDGTLGKSFGIKLVSFRQRSW